MGLLVRTFTVALLLAATATSYAIDPQQEYARERLRQVRPEPRPPVQQQYDPQPAARAHQEQQRRDSQSIGQAPSGFRSPQTVSIDRLNLRSDTLAEYRFEPVQTMAQEEGVATQQPEEQPAQSNAANEEVQSNQPSPEEAAEPEQEPASDEEGMTAEKVVTAGGKSQFRIIEEEDRIIIMQVDAPAAANGKSH